MKNQQLNGTTPTVAETIARNADRWHSLKGGRGAGGNGKGICAAAYIARPAFADFAARFISEPTAFNLGLCERTAAAAGGYISLPADAWAKLAATAAAAQANSEELREWLTGIAIKKLCAARVWFALCRDAQAADAVFGAPLTAAELAPHLRRKTVFNTQHGAPKAVLQLFELSPSHYVVADGEPFNEYGARITVGKRYEDGLWAAYDAGTQAPLSMRQPNLLSALRRALATLRRAARPQSKRRKKATL